MSSSNGSIVRSIKNVVIGAARDPHDPKIFHMMSLIAFFAWIGLGADGLSSSSYGPEEAFKALGAHKALAIFVAIATAATVAVISAGYSQIIELFPSGGGGYLVASKLISPTAGMVSGCALLVDYVLTITLSVASGADAVFSFLPPEYFQYRLTFAVACLFILVLLNMRGVKESVFTLTPIFLIFIATHAFAIVYGLVHHLSDVPKVMAETGGAVTTSIGELGIFGTLLIMMRAYSLGAGTYTGIEAVSNGLPILREPRVATGKRTMNYMAISLAVAVVGLMFLYVLYQVDFAEGKTLNAILFESITSTWPKNLGYAFVLVTLASEAALLFVAAQTGFLGGPRMLANMAVDRWAPTKFAMLSDRLVTQNGVIIMGAFALILMLTTGGSVGFLVVLYSINVFITFVLSQLGMVRHWWLVRHRDRSWSKKIMINGTGLVLCAFILLSVVFIKFYEGGWITILVTGSLVIGMTAINKHYKKTLKMLSRLDSLVEVVNAEMATTQEHPIVPECDPTAKTAVVLVNGFNGLGLHTLFGIIRHFGDVFKNFVFVQVGVIDAGVFKGADDISKLKEKIEHEAGRYASFVKAKGFFSEAVTGVDTDVISGVMKCSDGLMKKYPNSVFFGGQLVFPEDSILTRWLHNYIVFAIQRKFYQKAVPCIILPIRVTN